MRLHKILHNKFTRMHALSRGAKSKPESGDTRRNYIVRWIMIREADPGYDEVKKNPWSSFICLNLLKVIVIF